MLPRPKSFLLSTILALHATQKMSVMRCQALWLQFRYVREAQEAGADQCARRLGSRGLFCDLVARHVMTGACGLQQALWLQSRHARGAQEAGADHCAHRLGSRVAAAHDAQFQDGWRCAVPAWQAPAR